MIIDEQPTEGKHSEIWAAWEDHVLRRAVVITTRPREIDPNVPTIDFDFDYLNDLLKEKTADQTRSVLLYLYARLVARIEEFRPKHGASIDLTLCIESGAYFAVGPPCYERALRHVDSLFQTHHGSSLPEIIRSVLPEPSKELPGASAALCFINRRCIEERRQYYVNCGFHAEDELDRIAKLLETMAPDDLMDCLTTIRKIIEVETVDDYNDHVRWHSLLVKLFDEAPGDPPVRSRDIRTFPTTPPSNQPVKPKRPLGPDNYSGFLMRWGLYGWREVLNVIDAVIEVIEHCGCLADYTFEELTSHIHKLPVQEGLAEARFFRYRYGSNSLAARLILRGKEALVPKFKSWTPSQWEEFGKWIEWRAERIPELLDAELRSKAANQGGSRVSEARDRIRVLSTDKDVVRVLEAMKAAKIIEATAPQAVTGFQWKGKMNDKPGNYDAVKGQLDSSPSPLILDLIKELLAHAGPDALSEIGRFCTRR